MLNILELKQKQKQLDSYIQNKHNIAEDDSHIRKMKIALYSEIGEMLNERPDLFKVWKTNYNLDDYKFKEEFVDILHFALSIDNYTNDFLNNHNEDALSEIDEKIESINKSYEEYLDIDIQYYILGIIDSMSGDGEVLYNTIFLGRLLGITYKDMELVYNKKHKINIERQNNNY